jgi:hypothetical protein
LTNGYPNKNKNNNNNNNNNNKNKNKNNKVKSKPLELRSRVKNHALAQSLLSRFFSWDVVDVGFPTCLTVVILKLIFVQNSFTRLLKFHGAPHTVAQLYGLPHGILHVFFTLFPYQFQNPQIFQQTIIYFNFLL